MPLVLKEIKLYGVGNRSQGVALWTQVFHVGNY